MADRELTRSELLDAMNDTIILLHDALTALYAEALAAEQQDLAQQRGEED